MQGIFRLASQEGLCSMVLVSLNTVDSNHMNVLCVTYLAFMYLCGTVFVFHLKNRYRMIMDI
jgi:hypothetical protein